ncbi:transcriptional regulator, TrmB [Methanococcus vannielii SB]|uniref:Transcriptional regulator, TrmB n=1 Tax=Methanococcus vannielii (strain ATCC 35089 / DSM 1224 / JCM 13029 / OCM 148 / SB) TaxID=406327 RepID=A6UPB1_METVS|nr:winged helix-turn-helix domain-containing protein [Methanococcus vannielii]ABR54333.1 transcriptional regulator, TrmB [Methanococcus vannielii SB]
MNTIENVDRKLIENLANLMSSEVRAKIYIYLRKYDKSTVDDIADGTGIYPSTVRESILEMYNTGYVSREKMDKEGLGKKPYLYTAAAPSEIVRKISKSIQEKLNDLIMVDRKLESGKEGVSSNPVKIVVDEKYTE